MQDGETIRSRLSNTTQYKNKPVEGYALSVQLREQKLMTVYDVLTELEHREKEKKTKTEQNKKL